MVGGAVLAHQSCPVEAEHHVVAGQRHVVNDVVVGSLCERAVDVAERYQAILSHACRESHGMSLGYSHIERAVGHGLHHDVHRASRRHSRSHAHNLRVLLCQLQQRMSENVLVFRWPAVGTVHHALTRLRVELARCVPYGRALLGRLVAFPLDGVQVQQLRACHVLQLPEHPNNLLHVMAIERSEVPDVHALEDVLLMAQRTLQGVVEPYQPLAAVVVQVAFRVQPPRSLKAQAVVCLVGVEVEQVFLHSSHGTVNGHVVVVEDYE